MPQSIMARQERSMESGSRKSSLCVRMEDGQEGVGVIPIGLLQLLPDVAVPMVGAQAAVAARIGKRRADIALVGEEWLYHA
jgi:hypothetical protein